MNGLLLFGLNLSLISHLYLGDTVVFEPGLWYSGFITFTWAVMTTEITLEKLQRDIHTALQQWHDVTTPSTSLDYLHIFQQARAKDEGHARQVTNTILLTALETLAIKHKAEADLLRRRFLDGELMHALANRLNIGESTAYRKQQEALEQLARIVQQQEAQAKNAYQLHLEKRLKLPSLSQLFGVEKNLTILQKALLSPQPMWLFSIEGLGGIGKTALANALIRQPGLIHHFQYVAWVSARQHEFLPEVEQAQLTAPALTAEALTDLLLEQLEPNSFLTQSPAQKQAALRQRLKEAAHLVVIDNLETVVDYQALLPLLRTLAKPSQFLLTSRHSLQNHADVFCCKLDELSRDDTLDFIRHEATIRGLAVLAQAPAAELNSIYDTVGGNPLALKLVVGQIAILPLRHVLANLRQARGQKITTLYSFIYWQAWRMLTPASQQLLLVFPLTQEAVLEQLLSLSQLDLDDFNQALEQLITLSLVQVSGDLETRRYSIHRLTETFLLQEALKWQTLT